MSTAPFVIPEGLVLRQEDDRLIIEHEGDIQIHADPGYAFKRLVSRGGDVVLHTAVTVATVEAAGAFRASTDVELESLDAGTAHVDGDLKVDRAVVRGELSVDGDVDAEWVESGALTCQGLAATHLSIGGDVEVSGTLIADDVHAASLQCGGDLTARQLVASGEVAVIGAAEGNSFEVGGLSTGGDARIGALECAGDVDVDGGLSADRVVVRGRLRADGDLDAREVEARELTIGGDMKIARRLHTEERLEIGGDVEIAELSAGELILGGAVTATRLAATGELRTSGSVSAERLSAARVTIADGSLTAKVVEASERISVGAVPIRADILIAPHVELSPDASGKVSVVEARNELPPTRVKGCLSVEDLDELFGNGAEFLAARGVQPLGESDGSPSPVDRSGGGAPAAERSVAEQAVEEEAGDGAPEEDKLDDGPRELDDIEPIEDLHADDADGDDALDTAEPPMLDPVDDQQPLDLDIDEHSADEATDASAAVVDEPATVPQDDAPQTGGDEDRTDDDDELFGWADQMLTEVVAEDAIHHPDAEPDELMDIQIDSVIAEIDDSNSLISELDELEPEEPVEASDDEAEPEEDSQEEGRDDEGEEEEEDPIHGQMQETILRIATCYTHTEMPPAVTRLKDLVDARDYARIRTDITQIWNQLLKFHQKRGMRIQPQVTTTFNTINSLVRKL